MNGIYLIIGGNLGNRLQLIKNCKKEIEKEIGIIKNASNIYESEAWGETNNPNYLNQVLNIETELTAVEVLKKSLLIEQKLGRTRNKKWESRLIDIDILFFNNEIILEENLKIPHPHIQNRKFVLVPLNEIANNFIHPIFKKSVEKLLAICNDNLWVKRFTQL